MSFRSAFILFTLASVLGFQKAEAKMVYLYQKGEDRQVALAVDNGKLQELLTPPSLQAYHPEISSDGRYVAYSIGTIQPDLIDVAIHVRDLETDVTEVWTPSGNQYIHAEFSGNGEYLAFSGPVVGTDGKSTQTLHLVHLPTERAKGPARVESRDGRTFHYYQPTYELIPDTDNSYFPALASDGSFVVYHRTRDTSSHESLKELVVFDRIKKTSTQLTPEGHHGMVPSLSADNRYVAYAGIREGRWDIHVLDLWTQEDRQLTDNSIREFTPVFAPDGSITYTHISGGESMQLDLYRISREQVFGTVSAVTPEPFIADPEVMEYVPAFSGNLEISLQQAPSLPEPARSSFGAIEYQGKVYVAGGHQGPEHTYPPESFLDRLDIFDTATNTWHQGASMSVPRHGFEMVAHGGYIYAFGGFAFSPNHKPQWQSLDIIERYDIASDQWEVLPAKLPRNRSSNVAAVIDGKVYLIGGWDSTPQSEGDKEGSFHRSIDVFDLETEMAFTSEYTLPDPLRRAFTAVEYNGEILLLGGISEGSSHFDWLDNVTAFDPRTGAWRELPPLPFATFAPGAGVHNEELYFLGGMNEKFRYLNTIFSFGLAGPSEWTNTGRYLKENKGFPIVVNLEGGQLGILGGHTYQYTEKGVVDTPVDTFEILGKFPLR